MFKKNKFFHANQLTVVLFQLSAKRSFKMFLETHGGEK